MWFFQNTANASLRFSLPAGKDLIIGRKNCDLQIEGDQSISRKHATLHVAGTERGSKVTLTDNGSKFGSFMDGRRLSANQKVELSIGSELKFGQGPTTGTFKLVYEPLVFCCSSMAGPEKQRVKQLAKTLRSRVVNSWSSECTHLVMINLNVTIKVVSALSSCRPIVTPSWLEVASQCFSESKALPSPADYQPEVIDTNLDRGEVSFRPDFRRRTLFQDRTLYFLSNKQLATLHRCVESAGARCVDCSHPGSIELDTLIAKESVVIGLGEDVLGQLPQEQREWVEQVNNFLDSQDLRMIHDSEIGFALLYISIEKHCNPRTREGVPEVPITLPAPTLSQMPLTQFSQQPEHPPPVPPSQASSVTSILAPDSQVSSQSSTQSMPKHLARGVSEEGSSSSTTSDVTVKVNETIIHGAKSSHQDACDGQRGTPGKRKRGPTSSNNGSGGPKLKQPKLLDCLFDDEDLSPIQVKGSCKGGDSNHGPVTSTQATGKTREDGNSKTKADLPSSIVDDSQPDLQESSKSSLNTSKLPGLKTTLSHEKLLSNSAIGTEVHDQSSAQKATESHAPGSSLDGSVLVPSSLTPSSQRRRGLGDNGGGSQLPNSGLLSELFQSSKRRKKRGANVLNDNDDDVICIDDEERGKEVEGGGGGGRENPAAKKKRTESAPSVGAAAASEKVSMKGQNGSDGCGAERSEDKLSYRDRFSRPLDPVEQPPQVTSEGSRCKDKAEPEHKTPKKTPKKSPTTSTSPFLSTRKQKRKSTFLEDDNRPGEAKRVSGGESTPSLAAKSFFLDTPSTEHTAMATGTLTQTGAASTAAGARQKGLLTTPFTFLTTETLRKPPETVAEDIAVSGGANVGMHGKMTTPFNIGRRSKVRTAADELWEEDRDEEGGATGEGRGFDRENPLGTQIDEEVSSQNGVFKPVYAKDGFIVARSKPTRQVSRLGRFALRTKRELHTSPGAEECSSHVGGARGVSNSSQSEVQVEIVRTVLVFRPTGERRRDTNGDNGMTYNGLKNFKKFRKTLNTSGSAGIPRFINLTTYRPKEDLFLPDWAVSETTGPEAPVASMHSQEEAEEQEQEEEEEEEEGNDDDDDAFGFARPVVISKRRRR